MKAFIYYDEDGSGLRWQSDQDGCYIVSAKRFKDEEAATRDARRVLKKLASVDWKSNVEFVDP